MWFSEFPFLRYVIFFFFGIWMYPIIPEFPKETLYVLLLSIWLLYFLIVVYSSFKPSFPFKAEITFLAYMLLVLVGVVFSSLKDIQTQPHHLINQKTTVKAYLGVVRQFDEQKTKTRANRISLIKGVDKKGSFPLTGEIILYHRSELSLSPGQVVWVKGSPTTVKPPSNPGEFDYQNFLFQQEITHQHFVSQEVQIIGKINAFPLESFFINLRARLEKQIELYIKDVKSTQIAKALLLGQKKNLERETQNAYSTAGAMHVLAVSGLHVGIIYGFFFLFFKPLKLSLPRRIVFLIALIGLIWAYAFLTGLSPSVLRSATMFTLMSFALLFNRTPSIFNPVAISAVLLLMYDPLVGFSVGFQLSYAALAGILLFQPLILKLWLPKHKILEYFWQVSAVSIAAQIGTLPISIYYFHTFPTYFILANWVVIPAAFLIMALGIPFLLLSLFTEWAFVLGMALDHLLIYLNQFIFSISKLPFAQLTQLSIQPFEILCFYLLMLAAFAFWFQPSRKWFTTNVFLFIFYAIYLDVQTFLATQKQELIFFSNLKGVAINYFDGVYLYEFYHDVSEQDFNYKVLPFQNQLKYLGKKPLLPIENNSHAFLILPKSELQLMIDKGQKQFKMSNKHKVYFYENGGWKDLEQSDSISFHEKAIKIKIND